MAKLLKLRRGTNTQHSTFTGAEGEVTVNTTNDSLHVHDGTTAGGTELAKADLSNVNGSLSNNLGFADNVRARFGASNDLELFSDGTNGVVNSPTGDLVLSTTGTGDDVIIQAEDDVLIQVQRDTGVETAIHCVGDGTVSLRHNNATRLETTSTGINVTGTVTCDGLVNDGDVTVQSTAGTLVIKDTNSDNDAAVALVEFKQSNGDSQGRVGYITGNTDDLYVYNNRTANVVIGSGNVDRIVVNSNGLRPAADDTYDLGTASVQFRHGYFDGAVYCDEFVCDGPALIAAGTGELRLRDNDDSGNNTSVYSTSVVRGQDSAGTNKWWVGDASSGNTNLEVYNAQAGAIIFATNSTDRCIINESGHLQPSLNNTYDLGTSANRWRNVYTNDLNLSNEGGTNDVDGTWGSWTIQEGEDDLFLLNRRNGKKYKFNLSEVN